MRSIHTSGRTFLTPDGNAGYTFVALGNLFSARCVLLILVCCWRNLRWVLEQPEGSFLPQMERFEWLWGVVQVEGASNMLSKTQNICLNPFQFVHTKKTSERNQFLFCFLMGCSFSKVNLLLRNPEDMQIISLFWEAYTTTFYMGKFAGDTPKRHKLWGNDEELLKLIYHHAGYMSKSEQQACPGKTTRKYVDRHGKTRHVGLKDALRDSQCPD